EAEQKLMRGKLSIDAEEHVASWAGSAVALTATEFALLKAIAAQPRRAFTRENLMTAAYPDARFVSDRTIDSHIRHIRAKCQALESAPAAARSRRGADPAARARCRYSQAAGRRNRPADRAVACARRQ